MYRETIYQQISLPRFSHNKLSKIVVLKLTYREKDYMFGHKVIEGNYMPRFSIKLILAANEIWSPWNGVDCLKLSLCFSANCFGSEIPSNVDKKLNWLIWRLLTLIANFVSRLVNIYGTTRSNSKNFVGRSNCIESLEIAKKLIALCKDEPVWSNRNYFHPMRCQNFPGYCKIQLKYSIYTHQIIPGLREKSTGNETLPSMPQEYQVLSGGACEPRL